MPAHNTRLAKAKAKALANAVAKAKAKGLAKAAVPKPKAKAKAKGKAKAKAKAALPLAAPSDPAQPNANQNEDPHADGEAVGQNPQAEHPDVQMGVAAPANPNPEEEEVQEVPMNEGEQQGASRHNDQPPKGPPPQSMLSSIDPQFLRDLQTQGFIFKLDGQGNVVPVRMDTNYSPDIPETPTRHRLSPRAHTESRPTRDIPKVKVDLPSFSGDRTQTRAYWGRMIRLYNRMQWNFLDFRDMYFPSTLAGRAKTWYDQLPPGKLLLISSLAQLTDLFPCKMSYKEPL